MRKSFLIFIVIAIIIGAGYYFRAPIFDLLTPDVDTNSFEKEVLPENYRFAVSVDNSPTARPQSGLQTADLVIESPAEGSFTRYLAFFQNHKPERIGPVRSARPYFLEWVLGFDAIMIHSGGSKEALQMIAENDRIKNINEFYNSDYIKRDRSKPAPHNLFTSFNLLESRSVLAGWKKISPEYSWASIDSNNSQATTTMDIVVNYSNPAFATSFHYDPDANVYKRFLAGDPHLDAETGSQLEVSTLVVLETESSVIDADLLTIDLRTQGSGKATVFRSGKVFEARWRKSGLYSPIEILEADGQKVEFEKGLVWFSVVNQYGSLSW